VAIVSPVLRKWLAFGTGAGIELVGDDLVVTLVRVRPAGYRVLAQQCIAGFRQRPAAEWGAEYEDWLRKHGARGVAAMVLLPRNEVLVRVLSLAGVRPAELDGAIQLQLDALHPYGPEEVRYAWAPIPGSSSVLVAIARAARIDEYVSLFDQAGVRLAGFLPSPGALYAVLRFFGEQPRLPLLAYRHHGGAVEIYGESPARPVYSAWLELAEERALSMVAGELRADEEVTPTPIAELLPHPVRAPETWEMALAPGSVAAALLSACPHLSLDVNLLPVEHRSRTSRAALVPTLVLAGMVLAAVASLFAVERYEQARYTEALEAELARYAAQVDRVGVLEEELRQIAERQRLLADFRGRIAADLETLAALSRLIEPPAWLRSLDIQPDQVVLTGEAPQAAGLLKLLDDSPWFEGSEFTAPLSKSETGENFQLRARRERFVAGGRK